MDSTVPAGADEPPVKVLQPGVNVEVADDPQDLEVGDDYEAAWAQAEVASPGVNDTS